jgi:2,5-dihydroxypyridine 5,6-dioxygenase
MSVLNGGKLPLMFRNELGLCKLKPGDQVVLVTDLATRQDYVQAAFAAAEDLGAKVFEVKISTPFDRSMIASQGGAHTIENLPPVVNAVENADLVLVFHVALGAEWLQRGRRKGVRFLLVIDGPDELLSLSSPVGMKEAIHYCRDLMSRTREMHVTSAAGTDFKARFGSLGTVVQYGYADEPGHVDTWGGAHFSSWPDVNASEGVVVLDAGDCWVLPYVRYVESPVRLVVRDGYIREVQGSGVDAKLFRQYCDSWKKHADDMDPYAVSHLGWGLNPNSVIDQIAQTGVDMSRVASHSRSWPGVFLFSTGPNDQGGGTNTTPAHLDLPMFNCSVALDGREVIRNGAIVDEKMKVPAGRLMKYLD